MYLWFKYKKEKEFINFIVAIYVYISINLDKKQIVIILLLKQFNENKSYFNRLYAYFNLYDIGIYINAYSNINNINFKLFKMILIIHYS